ncbi:MAG: hypothetical protein ABIG87_02325 [Patescibacteria group bacterium]
MKFCGRKLKIGKIWFLLAIVFLIGISMTASAFVASSTNYRLQSDSLNTGGTLSTSTNYRVEDTAGEISTGVSTSTTYNMQAGYQQMQETQLSMSAPSDITMTALSLTQNTSVGSTTWTIITDSAAGYSATVYATVSDACGDRDGGGATDALCDVVTAESFADISVSKHLWNVSNEYAFGWSAFGNDVTGHGTDADCMASYNIPSGTLLWQGFNSTTAYQIASSTARTEPSGTATTMCVATEQDTVFAPSGTYYATTTITVITL